jgi:DNA-binding NtrC family response regulator
MAHVVVVTQDPDVRTVLDVFLHCEEHVVMSVPEGRNALPALELGRYPAVVIVHAPTPAGDGFDLLRRAASHTGGRLARHSYIILTAHRSAVMSARGAQLTRIKAQVMELPVDLADVATAVEQAERELQARELRIPAARVAPRGLPRHADTP